MVDPIEVAKFLRAVVLLLQNVVLMMSATEEALASYDGISAPFMLQVHDVVVNIETIVSSVLHDFRLAHAYSLLGDELG